MRHATPAQRGRRIDTRLLCLLPTALLILAGCNAGDATGPDMPAPDADPSIAGLKVAKVGDTYLRGSVKASVSDPEGKLDNVVIDWGDNLTTTVTSGFDALSKTHDYAKDGSYTVTITATDMAGNRVVSKGSLSLDPVPHACADIKVVGVCFNVHPDYKGLELEIKVFDNTVHKYSLSTTKSRIEVLLPIGGIWAQGKVILTSNFSRTKGKSYLNVDLHGCTFIAVCGGTIAEKKFTW